MGKKELKKIVEQFIFAEESHVITDDACEKNMHSELAGLTGLLAGLSDNGGKFPFFYAKSGRDLLIADEVLFDSKKQLSPQVENLLDIFVRRQNLKKSDALLTGEYKKLPPVSKGNLTARNYLANCAVSFGKKYDKLEEYKNILAAERCLMPGTKIKTCFFIQDITPLGSYIIGPEGMQELVLLYIKQFLDLFDRAKNLDYVFFGCFTGRSDQLWFMGRNDSKRFRKKEIDLLRKNYFAFDISKSNGAGKNG